MTPKYRAVLLVPVVVEFENPGNHTHVTEQARRLAHGFGATRSIASDNDHLYQPTLMEVARVEGAPPPAPVDPDDLIAPGTAA